MEETAEDLESIYLWKVQLSQKCPSSADAKSLSVAQALEPRGAGEAAEGHLFSLCIVPSPGSP